MKVSVNGDTWTLKVISDQDMRSRHGDLDGITLIKKKAIELSKSSLSSELIMHELLHAYISYMYLETAELDGNSLEEIYVDFFSNRGYNIYKQSKQIYQKLREKK